MTSTAIETHEQGDVLVAQVCAILLLLQSCRRQSRADCLHNYRRTFASSLQVFNSDTLRQWERRRKQHAEHTIMLAAKIISRSIAGS